MSNFHCLKKHLPPNTIHFSAGQCTESCMWHCGNIAAR
uniref:Uncharacterized protein n=1 Tax=Anguilla anguilla TaxID=7936 RepID=A0A0E9RBA5_ANGAN